MAPNRPTLPASTRALQEQGAIIFRAQLAAERLVERAKQANPTLTVSADELREIAEGLAAVSDIARRYHLERAGVGALTEVPHPIT